MVKKIGKNIFLYWLTFKKYDKYIYTLLKLYVWTDKGGYIVFNKCSIKVKDLQAIVDIYFSNPHL